MKAVLSFQERVRQRSMEALKQSALPPRMQLHEAVKKAQGIDAGSSPVFGARHDLTVSILWFP
jgi:hypothetical protein